MADKGQGLEQHYMRGPLDGACMHMLYIIYYRKWRVKGRDSSSIICVLDGACMHALYAFYAVIGGACMHMYMYVHVCI